MYNSTFSNNHIGIADIGDIAPLITVDTFNIPKYTGTGPTSYYAGTAVAVVNDQNIGVFLNGTAAYNLYDNTFQTSASSFDSFTTGTLEYSTGSENNVVTGNTFTGLGTAMLSNYINNSSSKGLLYQCNTDTRVQYDIAVLGNNVVDGGINPLQYTSSDGSVFPAGNNFGSTFSNIYNQQLPITYDWSAPLMSTQKPVYISSYVARNSISAYAVCYDPDVFFGRMAGGNTGVSFDGGGGSDTLSTSYAKAIAKVNYYEADTNGVPHRDSIYYWAGQMGTAYGDLLITKLLIQDDLIDSAYTVYDSIINKYNIDSSSMEGNEFVQGRNLISLLAYKSEYSEPSLTLNVAERATLQSVKENTNMWAHASAEGWLYAYEGDAMTDTLLYPNDTSEGGGRYSNPNQPIVPSVTNTPTNQVYPNPAHDMLEVMYTAQSNEAITIQIDDITGRIIITQQLQTGVLTGIDVSKLVPGMYLYRILEGTKVTMVGKVAKE